MFKAPFFPRQHYKCELGVGTTTRMDNILSLHVCSGITESLALLLAYSSTLIIAYDNDRLDESTLLQVSDKLCVAALIGQAIKATKATK
jgi:hypothetical protein